MNTDNPYDISPWLETGYIAYAFGGEYLLHIVLNEGIWNWSLWRKGKELDRGISDTADLAKDNVLSKLAIYSGVVNPFYKSIRKAIMIK